MSNNDKNTNMNRVKKCRICTKHLEGAHYICNKCGSKICVECRPSMAKGLCHYQSWKLSFNFDTFDEAHTFLKDLPEKWRKHEVTLADQQCKIKKSCE
jgi:hypothetical protein